MCIVGVKLPRVLSRRAGWSRGRSSPHRAIMGAQPAWSPGAPRQHPLEFDTNNTHTIKFDPLNKLCIHTVIRNVSTLWSGTPTEFGLKVPIPPPNSTQHTHTHTHINTQTFASPLAVFPGSHRKLSWGGWGGECVLLSVDDYVVTSCITCRNWSSE